MNQGLIACIRIEKIKSKPNKINRTPIPKKNQPNKFIDAIYAPKKSNKGVSALCATNTEEVNLWNCARDGSWPPEVYLQGSASNRPVLLCLKGMVVSD